MTEPRRVTIEEYEMMSPDERLQLLRERAITDLSQVDPEFLERERMNSKKNSVLLNFAAQLT